MSASTAPIWSAGFWSGYWTTLRPYLFGVSGVSGLAGMALVPGADPLVVLAATSAFLISYGLGQALTDVFQTDTDALSAPYRPLVRGELSRVDVFVVSLTGLLMCSLVFLWLNPWSAPVSVMAVAGLASYTPAKRVAWLGPAWNASIVATLPLLGALTASGAPLRAVLAYDGILPMIGTVFFSYAIFVILGYFKDVEADRRTGYDTLPVRLGRPGALRISSGILVATIVCSLLTVRPTVRDLAVAPLWHGHLSLGFAAALWIAGIWMLISAHRCMRAVRRDADAFPAIELCVRGFVLLHAGEAVLLRPSLLLPAVALVTFTDVTLRRRPMREQV